jgi:hypothetical protein
MSKILDTFFEDRVFYFLGMSMRVIIKLPLVRKSPAGTWEKYQVDGSIELEGDFAELSDLKERIQELLCEAGAEYQLLRDHQQIKDLIASCERTLEGTREQISVAQRQYRRLGRFLKACGIDPQESSLVFRERLLELNSLNSASVDVVEEGDDDPIPFEDF